MSEITITYIGFAQLKDLFETNRSQLTFAPDATIKDLREAVIETYPQHSRLLQSCMIASDTDYLKESELLLEGTVYAWIPPVSGG